MTEGIEQKANEYQVTDAVKRQTARLAANQPVDPAVLEARRKKQKLPPSFKERPPPVANCESFVVSLDTHETNMFSLYRQTPPGPSCTRRW